jgi:hypothetical protein
VAKEKVAKEKVAKEKVAKELLQKTNSKGEKLKRATTLGTGENSLPSQLPTPLMQVTLAPMPIGHAKVRQLNVSEPALRSRLRELFPLALKVASGKLSVGKMKGLESSLAKQRPTWEVAAVRGKQRT